jgi:hypothetical protein
LTHDIRSTRDRSGPTGRHQAIDKALQDLYPYRVPRNSLCSERPDPPPFGTTGHGQGAARSALRHRLLGNHHDSERWNHFRSCLIQYQLG